MIAQQLFSEDGKLRQTERPPFPASVQIAGVLMLALGAVIYLEVKNPAKDNQILDGLIFGFALTWAGQLRSQAKADQIKETNQGQNMVLSEIADKVNGGTTKALEALKHQHLEEMKRLAEEFRVARHDWNGTIHAMNLMKEHLEVENRGLKEQMALMNAQAVKEARIAERLADQAIVSKDKRDALEDERVRAFTAAQSAAAVQSTTPPAP